MQVRVVRWHAQHRVSRGLCHAHHLGLDTVAHGLPELVPQHVARVLGEDRDPALLARLRQCGLLPRLPGHVGGHGLVGLGVVHHDDGVLDATSLEGGQELLHPTLVVLVVEHAVVVCGLFLLGRPAREYVHSLPHELRCMGWRRRGRKGAEMVRRRRRGCCGESAELVRRGRVRIL
jgi:hypothetical protein